jgi:hypothetical protein
VGGYVREVEARTTFDGEQIVARLKPLKLTDAMTLLSFAGEPMNLVQELQKTLGAYVVKMEGPIAADGTQVSLEEFLSAAYFKEAVLEIGTAWIAKAAPANPPSPSASPSG